MRDRKGRVFVYISQETTNGIFLIKQDTRNAN